MRLLGLERDCGPLLDLDEIRRRLHLGPLVAEGETTIPVAQIIGTAGRAGDFDGCFRPLRPNLAKRIADIRRDRPMAPDEAIDVVRVDRAFFVSDGHKRVAIAHETGREFIDARVSRLASPYELAPGVDPEAIDRTAREQQFREASGLLESVPTARFALSDAGGYAELLEAVQAYAFDTSRRLGRLMTSAEAAACWYECIYLPTVKVGRDRVAELIDGCTDADVFLSLHRQSRALWGTECAAAELAAERLIEDERRGSVAGASAIQRLLRRARRRRAPAPALLDLAERPAPGEQPGQPPS